MEHLYKIIIGAILLICLSACGDKQGKQISAIIPLAESNPDSALKALSKIGQIRLSDRDMALYAAQELEQKMNRRKWNPGLSCYYIPAYCMRCGIACPFFGNTKIIA